MRHEIRVNAGLSHADAEVEIAKRLAMNGLASLPSLLSLHVGWGFGGAALQTLCSASVHLTELRTSLGATLSDWGLQKAVTSCPHLRILRLSFATITDAGGSVLHTVRCSLSTDQVSMYFVLIAFEHT